MYMYIDTRKYICVDIDIYIYVCRVPLPIGAVTHVSTTFNVFLLTRNC
jgi:hypothetical protein